MVSAEPPSKSPDGAAHGAARVQERRALGPGRVRAPGPRAPRARSPRCARDPRPPARPGPRARRRPAPPGSCLPRRPRGRRGRWCPLVRASCPSGPAASALASAVCRAFQTASGSGPRPHGALRLDTPVLQAPDPVPHGPEPRALLSARTGPAPRAPCSRVWLAALSQHGRKGEQRQTEPSPLASQQGLRPDFPHQRLISSASDIKPIQKQCFSRKHLSQGTDITGKETEDTDTERTRYPDHREDRGPRADPDMLPQTTERTEPPGLTRTCSLRPQRGQGPGGRRWAGVLQFTAGCGSESYLLQSGPSPFAQSRSARNNPQHPGHNDKLPVSLHPARDLTEAGTVGRHTACGGSERGRERNVGTCARPTHSFREAWVPLGWLGQERAAQGRMFQTPPGLGGTVVCLLSQDPSNSRNCAFHCMHNFTVC